MKAVVPAGGSGTRLAPYTRILPILLPARMARIHFMERMNARGNQISIHYPAVHQLRSYHKTSCLTRHLLPFTEAVAARENTLPLYASMQSKQVKWVVESVQSVLQVGAE